MKNQKKDRKHQFSLILMFAFAIFTILLTAITIASVSVGLFAKFEIIGTTEKLDLFTIIVLMVAISTILGTGISFFVMKFPLRPFNKLAICMKELSLGDYSVRLEYTGMINEMQSFNELSTSFNKLATELQNNQMLRSDFINNFSHEFKTPIASILGFARLLQKGELTEDEKKQYINAIEEEARRLSSMAMNVLNLTKVEKQEILNDVCEFNLSEQVRYCVLLLEDKWTKKNISPILDFEEFTVEGNEELLIQVWINLIDNAVKFSSTDSEISLEIGENDNQVIVSIANGGYEIPEHKLNKIWSRFYQADESHSSEGNGIGLAIVKRVVELHSGSVNVKSENGQTVFTVVLPKKQTEEK